ncbi:unnamed protein product [Protopolystoma xenopodis]|uniref:Uncharacterized protein n=1 Tax=Protopolystoma xenopodis TaxID=117903 RepID=A0A448X407_9PLAT|nr:unnamed protein product [Protopolystoma xenopodis]
MRHRLSPLCLDVSDDIYACITQTQLKGRSCQTGDMRGEQMADLSKGYEGKE